jgi:hypothetical protein
VVPNLLFLSALVVGLLYVWHVAAYFLSRFGWSRLAAVYGTRKAFDGSWLCFRSVHVGWIGYNGGITFGVNGEGIYLRPVWVFRGGHVPLFIPWSDIRVESRPGGLLGGKYVLTLAQATDVPITLSHRLGRHMAAKLGREWA